MGLDKSTELKLSTTITSRKKSSRAIEEIDVKSLSSSSGSLPSRSLPKTPKTDTPRTAKKEILQPRVPKKKTSKLKSPTKVSLDFEMKSPETAGLKTELPKDDRQIGDIQ